jgi:large subunit ribosomal protein L6
MTLTGVIEERIPVPGGVKAEWKDGTLGVTAKGRSLRRTFRHPRVALELTGSSILIRAEYPRKQEKALVGTWAAHVRNMLLGVTQGWRYEMKVVFSHFPVKVSVKGQRVLIENFLGEKHPRGADILGDTKVEVNGDAILLTGTDLEAVSQTAARIEQATRIRGFDPRIFQDGIYITKKDAEAS